MSSTDREKWNARYRCEEDAPHEPSCLLTEMDDFFPRKGTALDLAGGAGRHAIWLAERGLEVTLVDIAPNALAIARQRAKERNVKLNTLALDLERDALPTGPWDVIVSFHFLQRNLFPSFPRMLTPGGLVFVVQPTQRNLSRHAKPPARFLLADGELPSLMQELKIIQYDEDWLAEGRHEARLLAKNNPAV